MEFVTKKETYYRKRLRGAGETVTSDEKLDVAYPELFAKAGGKNGAKPKYEAKADAKREYEDDWQLQSSVK